MGICVWIFFLGGGGWVGGKGRLKTPKDIKRKTRLVIATLFTLSLK